MAPKTSEPTKVIRLPVWLIEHLTPLAEREGVTVPGLITRRLAPHHVHPVDARIAGVKATPNCTCKTPTFSKHVSNLCTTCKLMR